MTLAPMKRIKRRLSMLNDSAIVTTRGYPFAAHTMAQAPASNTGAAPQLSAQDLDNLVGRMASANSSGCSRVILHAPLISRTGKVADRNWYPAQ